MYTIAMGNPYFRRTIIECSVQEDEENSYYTGILNTLTEHCCGSVPLIIGNTAINGINDAYEDRWLTWALNNGIGSVIRRVRRAAARTGLGIAIPYINKGSPDPVQLSFKVISLLDLKNPTDMGLEDRIYDGIQYDENWNIEKIFVNNGDVDPIPYDISDVIIWHKESKEGLTVIAPECGPAFTLYPSVRRYMDSIIKSEEFRSSMPMALELDPTVYGRDTADSVPTGSYKYEPGIVPTLPPGVKMVGVPISISGQERIDFIELIIGASARCIQMPKNLALGDSSSHNMASSQFDMQPWINKINIDRNDFEPVTRKIFRMWQKRALLTYDRDMPYLPQMANNMGTAFSFSLNYDSLFQHTDPSKNANARAIDLISGSTTLTREFKKLGLNARRELEREAQLYGITREELMKIILTARNRDVVSVLQITQDNSNEKEQQSKK